MRHIKTKEDARQIAVAWQNRQSKHSSSYAELLKWQLDFEAIAKDFHLKREFRENGII